MEKWFRLDMPFWQFAGNTLIFSCLGLFPLLLLYVVLIPDFFEHLRSSDLAFRRFLRQVLTNGLPVVCSINYVSCFLFALHNAAQARGTRPVPFLLIDPPVRAALFILLHMLIYSLSADWFESFGGSRWLALQVVGPTLARSILFENSSGVYLYATLFTALPLYVAVVERKLKDSPDGPWLLPMHWLPRWFGSLLLAIGLMAGFILLVTGLATAIEYLQARLLSSL